MNYIAAKGKNEFGGSTGPELNFDGQVMYDVGTAMGLGKNTFRVGLEYQYWRNKFGIRTPCRARWPRPMVRAEYHFWIRSSEGSRALWRTRRCAD
jgi:hypothetical protein